MSAAATSPQVMTAPTSRDTLPWVEKYRPSTLEDVVAHEEILSTLRKLMDTNNMPHLLFYGPPGTGKTTTVKACAAYLYGRDRIRANVLELNASDDRGIDVVRNQIKEFSSTSSIFSGAFARKPPAVAVDQQAGVEGAAAPAPPKPATSFKLVVLDEADQMSNEAQAALRRVIEKYTRNVRFCILCNHVNKVIPAVQSRCTRFRFAPVKKAQMVPRLMFIAQQENIPCDEAGIAAAYKLSNGDLRRCLNMIQAAALSHEKITEDSVYQSTGNPTPKDIQSMLEIMCSKDYTSAMEDVQLLVQAKGASVVDIVREMYPLVMRMGIPQECHCFILTKMADLEFYMASGTQESVALAGLVGILQLVRESLTSKVSIARLAKC
ncbi:replication factor subunit 3, putative [Bodo saltans]|uniref:Replication factor subunit 3, putative n=1 Tax=Bodo saltans TaxID=75058 RepID=A0A0S4JGB9_BODSA|nr:replication factor subunit 3, putative [Bodo saltans]|eukprot:CUG89564.1 replication factor subunit 3, putative [Bodo saltans]